MREVSTRSRKRWHRAALLLLIVALGMVTSGCLRANVAMTISDDDRVSGQLLVSTQTPDGRSPFRLEPPPDLADRVKVTPYDADGRVGSKLSFDRLSFDELQRLAEALSGSDSRYKFELKRSGSLVTLDGSLDLTPLADTDSSVAIEVNAPGDITTTNGKESAGTVSWEPEPGEVTEISATYQFAGSRDWSVVWWTLLVIGGTFGVAALVGLLALDTHLKTRRTAEQRV